MKQKRIKLAGFQLSVAEAGSAAEILPPLPEKGDPPSEGCSLTFLSFNALLLALLFPPVRRSLKQVNFLYPGSSLLRWACRQLVPGRCKPLNPFQFIVETFIALNQRGGSLFLLGDSRQNIERAEDSVLRSFPRLRILGRYHGRGVAYQPDCVAEAVNKCAPDALLVGRGRFYRAALHERMQQGTCLYYRPIIKLFARYCSAGRKRLNFLRRNSPPFAFLLPWSWLKLPFALLFIAYVVMLKLRKTHDETV